MKAKIYFLYIIDKSEPFLDGKPIYVGMTTRPLGDRLAGHISAAKSNKRSRTHKLYNAIRDFNFSIGICEIVSVDGDKMDLEYIEKCFIKSYQRAYKTYNTGGLKEYQ